LREKGEGEKNNLVKCKGFWCERGEVLVRGRKQRGEELWWLLEAKGRRCKRRARISIRARIPGKGSCSCMLLFVYST